MQQNTAAADAAPELEPVEQDLPVETELDAEDDAGQEAQVATITRHPRADRNQHLRIVEAVLFATADPVDAAHIKSFLPEGTDVAPLLADLQANYANRGVNLVEVAGKWLFRTADDLGYIMRRETVEQRKLSKAAMETLAIIAYHQPVTRAEIEDIRGVAISKGTLDMLLEIGWVRMRGRRKTPGRPVTYGTTDAFLSHFGLNEVGDLAGPSGTQGSRASGSQSAAGLRHSDAPQRRGTGTRRGAAGRHRDGPAAARNAPAGAVRRQRERAAVT